uniref:Gap junction protein n=1 Tax=Buteo japonicus TaxID=224669 RepID=A0A8C0BWM9_9AVES
TSGHGLVGMVMVRLGDLKGKIWLMLIILLRMAVVVLAGYPLYQDEQERFVCNTLQPGCSNVCYDLFSPVSHFRFWLIQTVSILLPYAAFSIYVLHKVAMYIVRMHCLVHGCKGNKGLSSPKDLKELCRSAVVNRLDCGADNLSVLNFSGAYTVHLFFRTLLEAAFAAVQYFLFGFFVPERFSCYHSPCTSTVDCYISRPTEKSIMMIFIWGVSSLSFLLSVADLVCALQRMTARNQRNKLANLHVENDNSNKPCILGEPIKSHLGVSSSVVQSKLLGYYPSAELKNPDAQSNYSSTSCLRSKKSEWV